MTIAVVGAGPAGLLASILFADQGYNDTLFDEHSESGGHLTFDRYLLSDGQSSDAWLEELRSSQVSSSVSVERAAIVWAAYRTSTGYELAVHSQRAANLFSCDHFVLATGTTDLPLVCPGATLPGVMTARALRILLNLHAVTPGERFAIVGSGPETDRLAADLMRFGLEVVVSLPDTDLISIVGADAVEAIRTRSGELIAVDTVVVGVGESPDLQLARMVGLESTFDPIRGSWYPKSVQPDSSVLLMGGASNGSGTVMELVGSVLSTVESITAGDIILDSGHLPITSSIARQGAKIS